MMELDEIVVKESPGLCRCCLSEGCYKDLGTEYSWMNDTEIYADMLLECFDISISQHNEGPNGPNRLICEVCITRLRDACNFKKQVVESEKKFVDMIGRGEFRPKVVIYQQAPMKTEKVVQETMGDDIEVEYLDEDIDFEDDLPLSETITHAPSVSDDVTVSSLKLKTKRGRPKKTSTVKTEKKAKTAKLEDKPRTSKAVTKDYIARKGTLSPNKKTKRNDTKEQRKILTCLIENSTAMPFRWFSNKYMCFFCSTEFRESSKLIQHTKDEHEEVKLKNVLKTIYKKSRVNLDITNLSCKLCAESLETIEEFFDHIISKHESKIDKKESSFLQCFKLSDEEMSCLDCGEKFRFFGHLLRHAHNKLGTYICEICGRGFISKSHVESHVKNIHSGSTYPCTACSEIFPTKSTLQAHDAKVHNRIKLKCPLCPEILGSKYLKTRHLALLHDYKAVKFVCDLCGLIVLSKSKLISHVSSVHLKEKRVTCELCGFKAFNQYYLNRHLVSHSDERPFACEYCKKTFRRLKTLKFHVRIHTDDKRYACKDCGKAFVQITSLKCHVRTHHSQ